MADEVVRRLTIIGSTQGVDQATTSMNKLADSSNNVATVTDTNAKRALSAEAAFRKLTNSIDDTARSQSQIEKGTKTLNDALAQGVITQDKYNESLGLLKEKYADVSAANDNTREGLNLTGIEVASVANHVKQAAEAAYIFSSGFRAMVNPAIASGVSLIGTALGAMGVTASATASVVGPVLAGALASVLRLAGPIMLLVDVLKVYAFAWTSAGEQVEKYNNISKEAAASGVSTDYWQRISTVAKESGKDIDDATASLKKFKEVSADKLGGSDIMKKIDSHIDAGNLDSNNGVDKFSDANGVEAKYRAIIDLLKQMEDSKKHLAALDIVAAFATQADLEAYRANTNLFKDRQDAADKLSSTKLVNPQDIADAQQLTDRYDAAVKILSERWIPFQQTITDGGVVLRGIWVSILEAIAAAVTAVVTFATKIGDIVGQIVSLKTVLGALANNPLVAPFTMAAKTIKSGAEYLNPTPAAPEQTTGATSEQTRQAGYSQLKSGMLAKQDQSNEINKQQAKSQNDVNDAIDRAIDTLTKHIERQKADAEAVGKGDAALAGFRVTAAETAAVLANGGNETDKQKESFARLKVEAEGAADALAKAKVASEISRGRQTAFLSAEDVQIANQLKGIYGDDIPAALASTEAAALKANNVLKEINDLVRSSAASFANDFVSGIMSGKSAMDSLMSSVTNLGKSLTTAGINNIIKDPTSLVGYVETGVGIIAQLFGGSSEKKKKEEAARQAAAEAAAQKAADDAARIASFNMQATLASIDQSSVAGQLKAFDINSAQARADEAAKGNAAIVALENSLAAQRKAIVDKSNAAITKSMNDFLNSIKTGSNSILSPEDQLKFAQGRFNSDVTAGKTGDQDALNRVTQDAQSLLDLAKAFYASSTGYTAVYQSVTDAITGLASNTNPLGLQNGGMVGMAAGGIVGNGTYGVDSVMAKYAGGGNIALAGGEHVTKASSVNAGTRASLDYINRTGKTPGSDNAEVVRVLAQGFNGQTAVLSDKLDIIADRLKRLEDSTRQASNQKRVTGITKAA